MKSVRAYSKPSGVGGGNWSLKIRMTGWSKSETNMWIMLHDCRMSVTYKSFQLIRGWLIGVSSANYRVIIRAGDDK